MTPYDELEQGTLEGLGEDEARIQEEENKLLEQTQKKINEAQLKASKNVINKLNNTIIRMDQELNNVLAFRENYLGLAPQTEDIPKWEIDRTKTANEEPNIPVLLTSDYHIGELVKPEEIGDVNCYNLRVAEERIKRLAKGVLAKIGKKPIPMLYLLRLGDMVNGELREEDIRTNVVDPNACARICAQYEAALIKELLKVAKRIRIISTPGNHGRKCKKPESKNIMNNYDMQVTTYLELMFIDNKRIEFSSPPSGEAYFEIYNTKFLAMHGDRTGVRGGGTGFIGVSATIAKGEKKTRTSYGVDGKSVDHLLIGHFHTPLELEHTIANSSLVGHNQYARDLKLEHAHPSQTLFWVHPKYGVVDKSLIYVSHKEELKEDKKIYYNTRANKKDESGYIAPYTVIEGKKRDSVRIVAEKNKRDSNQRTGS